MDRQVDGAGRLSPVEESAAEVSTDSGNVSQSTSSFSMLSEGLSSGSVSQSHSFNAPPPHSGQNDEFLLQRTARSFSAYIRANADDQVYGFEKSLEEMLTRVDEFVGMLDMIRSDTSQIVNENLPQILRRSEEMREIYRKIDKLEAFVRIVGANVSAMEEQVNQAEGEQGSLPGAFKKIFRTMNVSAFLNKPAGSRRPQNQHQEVPSVFRTDDYFQPHMEH
ncbi:biogenesis of lysosome-related organelles complex 1 subunit 4 [Paramormyrops kingsleyae]|nr:biogenesis of lysosome-related organelles complex 1 subunit 4-like [Paramormyrops kingsleyae]